MVFHVTIGTLNFCRGLGRTRGHESIRIFNDLCKPIEIYIYVRKNHSFASYPAAKYLNAANSGLQTCDKRPVDLFTNAEGAPTLSPAMILQT